MKQTTATRELDPSLINTGIMPGDVQQVTLAPNDPFIWRLHPDQWDCWTDPLDGQHYVVPMVSMEVISNGINGINKMPVNPDVAQVLIAAKDRIARGAALGWIYPSPELTIPSEFLPPGVAAGGYLRRTPTKSASEASGYFWHTAFDTFVPDEQGRQVVVCDRRRLYTYLRAMLVASRKAQRPPWNIMASERALQRLLAPVQQRLQTLRGQPATDHIRDQIRHVEAQLKAIETIVRSDGTPDVEPEPGPKVNAKPKAKADEAAAAA